MASLPTHLRVQPDLVIPTTEIQVERTRASGPGGQHVNKSSTRVVLRWNVVESPTPTAVQRNRILEKIGPTLTKEGELIVASERHREGGRNLQEAAERLMEILRQALYRPRARKKTKPSRGSKERRLKEKKRRGDVKRLRRDPRSD